MSAREVRQALRMAVRGGATDRTRRAVVLGVAVLLVVGFVLFTFMLEGGSPGVAEAGPAWIMGIVAVLAVVMMIVAVRKQQ